MEIIKKHDPDFTIFRETYGSFKIDCRLSEDSVLFHGYDENKLKEICEININSILPLNKRTYIFYFDDYINFGEHIDFLESEGHTDIKKSDLYVYKNNEIIPFSCKT
ncbi:MAG: hypothetical protein GY828_06510 [Candidatus Gracilibacteria bacterium]|nr:hypothetical protein [Candidatus Gracilibacteria bacterium]